MPLGPQAARELAALAGEKDPELFFAGLNDFAQRQLQRKQPASAALAYQSVASFGSAFPELQGRATKRLAALQGGGETGARVEFLLHDLAEQCADPALILAMASAGLAYRAARLASLSRLAASPTARLWLGPRARAFAASLAGFALEAPTFSLAARVGHEAMARPQDWSRSALGRDFLSSALVLGGLKLGAAASASLERGIAGRWSGAWSLPSTPFQQAGMLGGIYLGRSLEERAGLRESQDGAAALAESLVTLLQFNVAGRLTPSFLAKDLRRGEIGISMQNQASGIKAGAWSPLSPKLALALPQPKSRLGEATLVLNSSHDNEGNSSPPPRSADSYRGGSSRPPVESGVILRDALAFSSTQRWSSADANRLAHLVEAIRVEMWNALNLTIDKPLARALGQGKELYVRVHPVDGSLDNVQIELSATPTPRERHVEYVELKLDSNQGSLELHDLPSQAAMLSRPGGQRADPTRSFLGFYRALSSFSSSALESAHLVAAMPANIRPLVLQQPTQFVRHQPAAAAEPFPQKFARAPEPALQTTNLVQYFPYVAEQARQEVERFAENAGIHDQHRNRLHTLVQKLIVGLHARESAEPRITRYAYLQARMRPDPDTPSKRIIEVMTPSEALKRPLLDNEVLFSLVRFPSHTGDTFPFLQHLWINTDAQGLPTRKPDLRFQEGLGLSFNLKMRLDSLSLEHFDQAAAQQWLTDNGYSSQE